MTVRTALRSPTTWHYITLGVGLVVILILQTSQWFFFDEWAFLKLDGPGLLTPHVGHWSTSPMLIFAGLRGLFGLHSYYPYAVTVTIAHLALCHVIWRITRRSGANPWIATWAVAILVFFGAGSENILWAFQVGFVGAMALALFAYYLATAEQLSRWRFVAVIALSLFSLTWSGTALAIIASTVLLLLRSHGWRRALLFLVINTAVYLTWYALFAAGNPNNPDTGGFSAHKLFVLMPLFLGVMLIIGWDRVFPIVAVVGLIATLVWVIRRWITTRSLDILFPALPLGIAAIIFAVLTAFSRAVLALGGAATPRYTYALYVLLVPVIAVAITRLTLRVRAKRRPVLVASVLLVLLTGYQGVQLAIAAGQESSVEQLSERTMSAALSLYVHHAPGLDYRAQPDHVSAPDISMSDLIALYRDGYISIGPFTAKDLAAVTIAVERQTQ